uniref:Phosphonoacetaldehyde hydrolase n=1 Tax=Plectus sambesii TaxID=2011161 RepID=A0A914XI92_9BILA
MSVWTNNRYEYRQIRRYHGSVKAVVFDWAGTVVDCGVFSPMNTFVKIFAKEGVHISESEARGPMGIHKRAHIEKILELEEVHDRWVKVRGAPPTAADVDRMYAHFVPIQMEAVADSAKPIDGVIETVAALRQRGIKIGSCTGYPMAVVNILKEEAAKFGYAPDCYVAADEVLAHGIILEHQEPNTKNCCRIAVVTTIVQSGAIGQK